MRAGAKERVYGPYAHGNRFRLRFDPPSPSEGPYRYFETSEEALSFKGAFEKARDEANSKRLEDAIDEYESHLVVKGNKKAARTETIRRVRLFLDKELSEERSVRSIGGDDAASIYKRFMATPRVRKPLYGEDGKPVIGKDNKAVFTLVPPSVDYHRNALAEVKTFFGWCMAKPQGYIDTNPFADVKGEGSRNVGKPQPRIDDARLFYEHAVKKLEEQRDGWQGALAALLLLYGGPRASELTTRIVDDVDDQGAIIRVVRGKTRRARRPLPVPPFLRPYLLALVKGRDRTAPLFVGRKGGFHARDWPRERAQALCREVGIPPVTAHGLRGFNGSVLVEQGVSVELIQKHLGHEHRSTTERSYIAPASLEKARQDKVLRVLTGGRSTATT